MTKREIKFRAWDEEFNQFITWEMMIDRTGGIDTPMRALDELPHDQYTGLKDINGVEIYEGDYLLTTWESYEPLEEFGEVQFVDGAWRVISSYGDDLIHEWIDNGTSVQGNIHEQPEWRV